MSVSYTHLDVYKRQAFQYSDGFLVEDRDKTFLHLDVAQTSVLVDGETKDDSTYWLSLIHI